jgi:hypothetical protein
MFAKDFNLLNEIYNQQIFKEDLGLGPDAMSDIGPGTKGTKYILPKVRPCPNCDAADECGCGDKAHAEDDMVFADEPVHSGYDSGEDDVHEHDEDAARMTKQELFRIAKMAYMLHDIICDSEELKPWLSDKISRAYEGLNSVFAYKDYEKFREELEGGAQVEEGTEKDLFDSIMRAGDGIVGQIRKSIQHESSETVEKIFVEVINVLESKKR